LNPSFFSSRTRRIMDWSLLAAIFPLDMPWMVGDR
jgi:hypothetical protein